MTLPRKLAVNGTINLVLETVQTHATYPYPAYATQKDPQLLKYDTDLFVLSPYTTLVQRTKVKFVRFLRILVVWNQTFVQVLLPGHSLLFYS